MHISQKMFSQLDTQSFKKIFPQQYYTKFAKHIKALQYQKQLFSKPPQKNKLHFIKRQSSQRKRLNQQKLTDNVKAKISKFAKINDVINADKLQIVRFKAINKEIDRQLKYYQTINNKQAIKGIQALQTQRSNHKRNGIKVFNNQSQVPQKIIQEMFIQTGYKQDQRMNKDLKQRAQSQRQSSFKRLQPQPQNKSRPQLRKRYNSQSLLNIQNSLSTVDQKSLRKTSLILNPSNNQSINPQNKSILKNKSIKPKAKLISSPLKVMEKNGKEYRRLIQQTEKLVRLKNNLKTQKLYQTPMFIIN